MRRSLFLLPLLAAGCADYGMKTGDLGVTPGGAQDIGYARDIIEQGGIPSSDTWSAEGLFSEHDLPLSGETCDAILCPRAQAAWLPLDGAALVQVGFGTDITAESFERRPLNLGLAVDISGSMSGEKIEAMRTALHALADRMTADDTVSLVAFDDRAELRLEATRMDADGREALRRAIDKLNTRGGTNIEAGMQLAYQQVGPLAGPDVPEDRVMLFTDAQPNVGDTSIAGFTGMARYYGAAGIGLTVFGTGLDLGIELAQEMSELRGGAYVYLPDVPAIAEAFDEDFDYLVTPLAYDLQVELQAAEGWRFVDAVGAPLDQPAASTDFGASTLFLSSNQGGMAVLLAPIDGAMVDGDMADGAAAVLPDGPLATMALRYERASDGVVVMSDEAAIFRGGDAWQSDSLGESSPLADDEGVFKMAMLLDEVDALTVAGLFCDGTAQRIEARSAADSARIRLQAVSDELESETLRREARLMGKLSDNLEAGASCW